MCSGLDTINGARFIALSISHRSLFMNVDQCSVGIYRDGLSVIMNSETRRRNFLQRRDHNALRFGGVGTFRHCYTLVGNRVMGVLELGSVCRQAEGKCGAPCPVKQKQRPRAAEPAMHNAKENKLTEQRGQGQLSLSGHVEDIEWK